MKTLKVFDILCQHYSWSVQCVRVGSLNPRVAFEEEIIQGGSGNKVVRRFEF